MPTNRMCLATRALVTTSLLALLLATGGCKRAFEVANCQSASAKACEKWFACWPGASTLTWGTVAVCKSDFRDWCQNTTDECSLDDDALLDCDKSVADSPCGSLPASCTDLENCYTQTH
jgi:hypothetical protein